MFLKQKKIFIGIFIVLSSLGFVFVAHAQDLKDAFGNANTVAVSGGYNTGVSAENMIAKIISVVLSILGVLFLVLMIYGGYIWMMARDNEQEVTRAKNLITAAVIGVVVIVSAYAISYFVVESVSKDTLGDGSSIYEPSPY